MRALAIQFMKYAIAGLAGTAIHALMFAFLNETILKAGVEGLPHERGINYLGSNAVAFFIAGIFRLVTVECKSNHGFSPWVRILRISLSLLWYNFSLALSPTESLSDSNCGLFKHRIDRIPQF